MLVIFKSKAAAEVMMYEEHAKRLLDLLGKDVARGVITAEETDGAIARIEQESERMRLQEAEQEQARRQQLEEKDEAPREQVPAVSFATRAYPLLEMLRAAKKGGHAVTWGV